MNSLPKTVTRQRHGCDLNPGPSASESSTLITRLPNSIDCSRIAISVCIRFMSVCMFVRYQNQLSRIFLHMPPVTTNWPSCGGVAAYYVISGLWTMSCLPIIDASKTSTDSGTPRRSTGRGWSLGLPLPCCRLITFDKDKEPEFHSSYGTKTM